MKKMEFELGHSLPPDILLLDRSPNIGPLITRWDLTSSKIADQNRSFRTSKILTLVSAIFELVNFPTSNEWSNIKGPVQ
jgi:hypothetical protein